MNEFNNEETKVNVKLLEKTFQIKCPPDKVDELQQAAIYLDQEMKKMRRAGVVGMDRVSIITALNLAHRLLEMEGQREQMSQAMTNKIRDLQIRIDDALTKVEQLEL